MIMIVLFFSIMLAIPLMMYTKYQKSSDLLPGLIKFKVSVMCHQLMLTHYTTKVVLKSKYLSTS